MPLIPLQLPPGVYRNGTDLQSAGRWRDASLVRWTDGTMRPVGGWLTRATVTDQPLRGALAWRDLDGDRWFAAGSHLGLFVGSANNTTLDPTAAAGDFAVANCVVIPSGQSLTLLIPRGNSTTNMRYLCYRTASGTGSVRAWPSSPPGL